MIDRPLTKGTDVFLSEVALGGPEFTMKTKLASNFGQS